VSREAGQMSRPDRDLAALVAGEFLGDQVSRMAAASTVTVRSIGVRRSHGRDNRSLSTEFHARGEVILKWQPVDAENRVVILVK
jgi:hypothetical protein